MSNKKSFFIYIMIVLFLSTSISTSLFAQAKKILFIAPHEDDETIACAGAVKKAVNEGHDVRLLMITTGDYIFENSTEDPYTAGEKKARTRLEETLFAMQQIGIPKEKVYYLGFGDASVLDLYALKYSPLDIFTTSSNHVQTYGFPDLVQDYHFLKTGAHGPYNRQVLLYDITSVLIEFLPDEIYVSSAIETHPDHRGTFYFTMEALLEIKKIFNYSPVIHEYHIYKSGLPQSTIDASALTSNEEAHMEMSPYRWDERESILLPDEMLGPLEPQSLNVHPGNAHITTNFPVIQLEQAFDNDERTLAIGDGTKEPLIIDIDLGSSRQVELLRVNLSEPFTHSVILNGDIEAADNLTDLNNKTGSYVKIVENLDFNGKMKEILTHKYNDKTLWRISFTKKVFSDIIICIPEIQFCGKSNQKASLFRIFHSQNIYDYFRFIKRDEVFWKKELSSLSYYATVSHSSQKFFQPSTNVKDGIILGSNLFGLDNWYNFIIDEGEWLSHDEGNGAWIKLEWDSPVTANQIVLYDRVNPNINVLSGELIFSNGYSIDVNALDPYGKPTRINFPEQTFQWVRFVITESTHNEIGLSEFEVYNVVYNN